MKPRSIHPMLAACLLCGLAWGSLHAQAQSGGAAGDTHVTTAHLPTDHAYSDQRTELSQTVLEWLAGLPGTSPTRSSK